MKRELEQGLEYKCPYCREPIPDTKEEGKNIAMKRVEVNDPVALFQVGAWYYEEGDYETANEYYTKAAALGNIAAHFNLCILYRDGKGVEKNEKKEVYHLEEAAIGGYPDARYILGAYEGRDERYERALKHWIIAAKLGHDGALEAVKVYFSVGLVSKDDYEAALRGHQAAVDANATKSEQREEAYAVYVDSEA
jgi:TPR repeat protein